MPFAAMPPGLPTIPTVQAAATCRSAEAALPGKAIVTDRDGDFVIVADRDPVAALPPSPPLALGHSVRIDRALLIRDGRQDRSVRP